MNMKAKTVILTIIITAVILGVAFFIYVGNYYHADEKALAAMESGEAVTVNETGYGWLFDGPSEKDALIFYPGGKIEARVYAPLCRALAESGMDVCLVKMPFNLAFFGMNKADEIIGNNGYEHYYIGGHSLGGVFAAEYASENSEKIDGLIMLAAYSASEIESGTETILIYGSEDKVLNLEKYHESFSNLPGDAEEHIIPGGNHAQFGSYGAQKGDGEAAITPEMQIEETVEIIIKKVF